MDIKLLDVFLVNRPDSKLLGYALVQLSDKMKVMMSIFKNNNGHLFVKFPSVKIGDQYKPQIEFINLNIERDISAVIADKLEKKFNITPNQPQQHATGTDNDFNF